MKVAKPDTELVVLQRLETLLQRQETLLNFVPVVLEVTYGVASGADEGAFGRTDVTHACVYFRRNQRSLVDVLLPDDAVIGKPALVKVLSPVDAFVAARAMDVAHCEQLRKISVVVVEDESERASRKARVYVSRGRCNVELVDSL